MLYYSDSKQVLYYQIDSFDSDEPGKSFESTIDEIKETNTLNDADLVRAFKSAFRTVGALIALSRDWRDGISYERVKVRCFLFNTALAGAKSYLDSIQTEQFEMKPINYGPGASEDDIRYGTTDMIHLIENRFSIVEAQDLHKELARIVADLMPRIIDDFRTYDPKQRGSGWINTHDILESVQAWSRMDPQEGDVLLSKPLVRY